MEELEEPERTVGEERVILTLNHYGSGMSYRLVINDAKNFEEAIEKIMVAKVPKQLSKFF